MSQSAAELTVQDLRDMRRSFSRQELLDLIDRMFTDENAALDMDVVDAAIFRLRRGQLQHHINGFYLLRNCPFSAVTDDVVGNLQQSAHLHLPHTGIGHAHGVVNR